MRRLMPTVLFALGAMAWASLGYQPATPGGDAEKAGPPQAAAKAIFPGANIITISGPVAGGKTITLEGLPPGTTEWLRGNPTAVPPKDGPIAVGPAAGLDPAIAAKLTEMEENQKKMMKIVLDLQKQLAPSQPK